MRNTLLGSVCKAVTALTPVVRGAPRTGAAWRDLPERNGSLKTVYSRFRCWDGHGIWERVFAALLAEARRRGELDWVSSDTRFWDLHHIDSRSARSLQHAAGARKKGDQAPANREESGRSRGGFFTKLHMRVDGRGRPLTFLLPTGQHGIGCLIPLARTHRRQGPFDRAAYRQRNQVERFFARIQQFRRVTTRYEKLENHHLAIKRVATVVIRLPGLA